MKLKTQFMVTNKELKDLDYVKKVDFFRKFINIIRNLLTLIKKLFFDS